MAKSRKKRPKKRVRPPASSPAAGRMLPGSGVTSISANVSRIDAAAGMRKSLIPASDVIQRTIAMSGNRDWMETELLRQDLVRKYHGALVENGYGMPKRDLLGKDIIDMRAVKRAPNPSDIPELPLCSTPEYMDYLMKEDMFYRALPCFTEGVVRCNADRYIHFRLMDVDTEGHEASFFLQDYMTALGVWTPGVSGRVTLRTFADRTVTVTAAPGDKYLYSRIYRMLDYRALFARDRKSVEVWEKIVLPYADRTERAMAERDTDNVIELTKIFFQYMAVLNFYLLNNRPKPVRGPKKAQTEPNKGPSDERETNGSDKGPAPAPEQPTRLVRTVGIISVTSERPPKAVTPRSLPNYKLSSWKVRGFTRRTRSGKLVYVKESVRHRKMLQSDGAVPQSVIRLKGEKPGGQTSKGDDIR